MVKHRKPGEGTIFQHRALGRWCAQVTLDGGKRKTIYGASAREVREKLTALTRDRDRGIVIAEGGRTVAQWLAEWLDMMRPPRVNMATWISYETRVRIHIIPGLGRYKLDKLSPHQVQQFYRAKLAKGGISSTTVRRIHDVLHNALDDAMRLELVARNVSELVDAPREAAHEGAHYSVEQLATLLQAIDGHRLEALIILAITTGMREGELLALQWRDVDMTCGAMQIRGNRTRAEHGYVDGPTKTRSSAARILLSETAVDALRRQRVRVREHRLRAGDRWQEHDLVFPSLRGTHHLAPNLNKMWIRIVRDAGLPYIRLHDLRHTSGTLLLAETGDIKQVSAALRHSKIGITADRYAHVTPNMQASTAEAMERIMRRARGESETTEQREGRP